METAVDLESQENPTGSSELRLIGHFGGSLRHGKREQRGGQQDRTLLLAPMGLRTGTPGVINLHSCNSNGDVSHVRRTLR